MANARSAQSNRQSRAGERRPAAYQPMPHPGTPGRWNRDSIRAALRRDPGRGWDSQTVLTSGVGGERLGCETVAVLVPPPRAQRLSRLFPGLLLYGASDGMILLAGLGVDPWDVLHQGLSRRLGLGVGTWAVIVGLIVLALWIPLSQRPGVGTVCNVVVVGVVIDIVLAVFAPPHQIIVRWVLMLSGVVLNGVATAAYIGAGLGPGPRDGLMTGLAARGHPVRIVRTAIELTVLAAGWLLGGTVGIGTVVYALSIGPLAHYFLPRLNIDSRPTQAGQQSTSPPAESPVAAFSPGGGADGS